MHMLARVYAFEPLQTENKLLTYVHAGHVSHCQIKSHRNWPIWKAIPIKNKSHRILTPFHKRFYEEININHTLFWFSQASMKKKKTSDYIGGAPK